MSEYALTPRLGLYKPTIDADDDLWGDHLNANADVLDAAVGSVANVLSFGAVPGTSFDCAPAINAALATGKSVYMPKGSYHIRSALNVGSGGHLYGDGRGNTMLSVWDDFSPSAMGMIVLTGAEDQSPILEGFSVRCNQPQDQGSRANFKTLAEGGTSVPGGTGVKYPPVILSNSSSGCRFKVKDITVYACWDGIVSTPNNAPWIEDVEMGALNCGLNVGQARDFSHIRGYHFWSFGITGGQPIFTGVFQDGNTFAARFGENGGINGGNVVDFCSFLGRVLIADTAQTWMHFANLMMDGNNATLEVGGAAWLQISNVYFTGSPAGANPSPAQLSVSGGRVFVSNIYASTFGKPAISVTGGALRAVGGRITQATPSVSSVVVSSGSVVLTGVGFSQNTGAGVWTAPVVSVTGSGTARIQGCTWDQPSIGDIGAIVLATDNASHAVLNNSFNGWAFTPPGTLGMYQTGGEFYTKTVHAGSVGVGSTATTGSQSMTLHTSGQKTINYYTNNVIHWASGSLGSAADDWALLRFNDAGTQQATPFAVSRATGAVSLGTLAASTSYASDAAAASGGVAVGQLYRNGSAVMVRVV